MSCSSGKRVLFFRKTINFNFFRTKYYWNHWEMFSRLYLDIKILFMCMLMSFFCINLAHLATCKFLNLVILRFPRFFSIKKLFQSKLPHDILRHGKTTKLKHFIPKISTYSSMSRLSVCNFLHFWLEVIKFLNLIFQRNTISPFVTLNTHCRFIKLKQIATVIIFLTFFYN
jgi:hypothetical protein